MNGTWPQEPAMPLFDDELPDGWDGPDTEPLPAIRLPALAEVEAQELVQRLPAYGPQTAADEATGWLALRTPVHATEDLLAVMRSSGPGPRCVAAGLPVP